MKSRWIEVDDNVWRYLQKEAEPLVDTPNSVLRKLLLGNFDDKDLGVSPPISVSGLPKALAQILEVIYEVERHKYTRSKATRIIADRRGTLPQTIMDKYCRQLGKNAQDVDILLEETGYVEFKEILKEKFPDFSGVIDIFIETMLMESE